MEGSNRSETIKNREPRGEAPGDPGRNGGRHQSFSLAGAVAKAGGIGIISTAQIGFKDQISEKNPMAANLRAIHSELKKPERKRRREFWALISWSQRRSTRPM